MAKKFRVSREAVYKLFDEDYPITGVMAQFGLAKRTVRRYRSEWKKARGKISEQPSAIAEIEPELPEEEPAAIFTSYNIPVEKVELGTRFIYQGKQYRRVGVPMGSGLQDKIYCVSLETDQPEIFEPDTVVFPDIAHLYQ